MDDSNATELPFVMQGSINDVDEKARTTYGSTTNQQETLDSSEFWTRATDGSFYQCPAVGGRLTFEERNEEGLLLWW